MNAKVIFENGHAAVSVNGKVIPFSAYRSWRPKAENYAGFAKEGFPFVTLLASGIKNRLGLPYSEYGEYWLGEGVYDWDVLRRQMDLVIENAPDAYIIMNLMVDTRDWFLREHPECLYSFHYYTAAAGYEVFRRSAQRMLTDTIDFLEREYPEKVFCIFLSGGATCEWRNLYHTLPENPLRDEIYRKYIGNPDARVPTEEEIAKTTYGSYRDKRADKCAIDFLTFNNEIVTDSIAYFAKAVKEHTQNRLLVAVAAGYATIAGDPLSGHSAAADVARIPEIDIIFCPASYIHRVPSGVSASQAAMDSIRANGKMMVTSVDNRSYASRSNIYAQIMEPHYLHDSMEESISYVRRETALAMSKGAGFWIFDMYGVNYPEDWHKAELGKIRLLAHELRKHPVEYNSEVAVLYDPRSTIYTNAGDEIRNETIFPGITEIGRIGCPVDHYAIDDILLDSFPKEQYKLYLLPNCLAPTEAIRKKILELREHASFIFTGATGCIGDEGFSFDLAEELTGIRIEEDGEGDYFAVVDKEYTDLGYDKVYRQFGGTILPSLKAKEKDVTVMGRQLITSTAKLVMKERRGGFDVWSARGAIPESALRPLAKRAGVFLYQEHSLPTYANSRMLALFDHKGGIRTLKFPKICKLREYYTNKSYEYNGTPLEVEFEPNECKVFLIEP